MITRKQVADERRVNHTAEIFGIHFRILCILRAVD